MQSEKRKVAFFINALAIGGAETVLYTLACEMVKYHQVTLVLIENCISFRLPDEIRLIALTEKKYRSSLNKMLAIPALAKKLTYVCQAQKIDVCFSFLDFANLVAVYSKKHGNIAKIVINERTYLSEYFKSHNAIAAHIAKAIIRKLYPKAEMALANSKAAEKDLINNYGLHKNRTSHIYNPINLEQVAAQKLENAEDSIWVKETFRFIHVGLFRKEKNHELLLRAFAALPKGSASLVLVGDGANKHICQQLAAKLGIAEQVHFFGQCNRPIPIMNSANCLILCSDYEGFPNVILEALACGLPIISTDCLSGPREILAPHTERPKEGILNVEPTSYGSLIPVNRLSTLTEAMHIMMQQKDKLEGYRNNALTRVKEFDLKTIMQHWLSLIT